MVEVIDCSNIGFSLDDTQPAQPQQNVQKKNSKLENTLIKDCVKKDNSSVTENQEYILVLSRYNASERFSGYLKKLSFDLSQNKLKKMTTDELKETLVRVRASINNKNMNGNINEMVLGGIGMAENVCVNTKINNKVKLKGLSKALREDDEFMDLVEQISLENSSYVIMNPYQRLAYSIVTTMMRIHAINTLIDRQKTIKPSTPVQKSEKQNVNKDEEFIIDLDE